MAWSLHRSLPAAAHSDGLVPTRPNGRVGRSAKSGTLGDYKGGRSLDQLMAFANKLISPMLQTGTAALIRAARQASPVVFVFVDADDSRRAHSPPLSRAPLVATTRLCSASQSFEALAGAYAMRAPFYTTQELQAVAEAGDVSLPALVVFRDGVRPRTAPRPRVALCGPVGWPNPPTGGRR